MAPWEKYQQTGDGPWAKYAQPQQNPAEREPDYVIPDGPFKGRTRADLEAELERVNKQRGGAGYRTKEFLLQNAEPIRSVGRAGKNAVQGIMGLPALAMDSPALAFNLGSKIAGADVRAPLMFSGAVSGLDQQFPALAPRNNSERFVDRVAQGIAGAGTGVGIGATLARSASPVAAGVGQTLATNPGVQLAAGATGAGASDVARQAGAGPVGQILAGIAGGAIPAAFASRVPTQTGGLQSYTPQPSTPQAATFASGRELGLVAPPASVSGSFKARAAETLGGKIATAQDASVQNMPVFTSIAKRALGIADDADHPLTQAALNQVRRDQGPSYEAIRGVGPIQATDKYMKALQDIAAPFRSAGDDFASLGKSEVVDLIDDLAKPAFKSSSAVDAIQLIRDRASKAYASGDKTLGGAYKQMAKAMEDVIEDNLAAAGGPAKEILRNFRAARQMTAKTYSVEKALNPATGVVSGTKLAQQLAKGTPLSGDLKSAAQFAQAFPKASREILDSGSVRNTDLIVGGGTAAVTGHPGYLIYPMLRNAARNAVLSKAAQERLLKEGRLAVNPAWFGGLAPISVSD